ncbi:MAG: hypothetical protein R3F49_19245 [Planctomycetota bacterium]
MRLSKLHLLAAGALMMGVAPAQIALNELYVSMAGDDDDEFIELIAAPGTSLDGYMILVVESDDQPGLGELDRVWDLSGNSFGLNDPYFVVGNVSAAVNPDFALNGINSFENSSATFYLVHVPDPGMRATITSTWFNNDIRTAVGATTTWITTTMGVTLVDHVAILDSGATDMPFDNALAIGPDGTFFPAGIYRSGDCPNNWCTDEYSQFTWDPNGSTNGGTPITGAPNDPTPGTQNYLSPTCMTAASSGSCAGAGNIGTAYCVANPNSTGGTGVTTAAGSTMVSNNSVTLNATGLPNNAFAFFLTSRDAGFIANPGGSQGNLCLAGSIGRYVGPGQIQNSGAAGSVQLAIDLTQIPQPTGFASVLAGDTWRFTCWHRDVVGGTALSNFSNGLEIAFN